MTATTFTARRAPAAGRPVFAAGLAVLALALLVVLFPALFATHDPDATDFARTFQPPGADHFFGTDQLGRDVFSRVVYGARVSLTIALGATAIGVLGGMLLGLLSAVGGRIVDGVLMRCVDVLLAFPELILALLVVAVIGGGAVNIAVAIGTAAIPAYARVVRGQAGTVILSEYVEAARVLGVRRSVYLARHVVPNVAGPVVVLASIGGGTAIVTAAGLSLLGLGPPQPTAEWGAMLAEGKDLLGTAWWIAVFPGMTVALVVVAFTLVGRNLQVRSLR
ncbi:peptide/nickel transport system permease protein [Sinosporangium album]|uniref:Peptide/nickel transport system permease protein n=1 Tax=Sinosporangium album TaxID=504805 RepID=A0A1G7YEQ4_9ACTN|nr:ABC transporter permease [Sinosporangium album]SDG94903.1 peptide/nickel transport system permease protein [Sinosporangium album]